MTDYKPGTVAVATVLGESNVRIIRGDGCWVRATDTDDFFTDGVNATQEYVTNIRPLVVLDLEPTYGCSAEKRDPAVIVARLRDNNSVAAHAIADQIEAQTKPPRIPEPGFGAVVEAGRNGGRSRRQFVRAYTNPNIGSAPWTDGEVLAKWDDLDDPVLIREGVA